MMSTSLKRHAASISIAAVGLLSGFLAVVLLQGDASSESSVGTQFVHGADRRPDTTASDWVTYADYVVVVTPVSDTELPPTAIEVERGEGLILRKLELRVDEVLWRRPGRVAAAPETFTWTAHGWQFSDNDPANRVEMAARDEPRVETGHSYVMAIVHTPARCSPGDFSPAGWRGLGTDSIIPFDGGVLGQGEEEGETRSAAASRAKVKPDEPNFSLEDRVVGTSKTNLRGLLERAKPTPAQQFGPSPESANCG